MLSYALCAIRSSSSSTSGDTLNEKSVLKSLQTICSTACAVPFYLTLSGTAKKPWS